MNEAIITTQINRQDSDDRNHNNNKTNILNIKHPKILRADALILWANICLYGFDVLFNWFVKQKHS